MTHHDHVDDTLLGVPDRTVQQRRLVDVQDDRTQVEFLRHYVYNTHNGNLVRSYDTDFNGTGYTRTGIQTREPSYDVYTGLMCVEDPDFPGVTRRVKQFVSDSGIVSYTTVEGFAYEIPDNGASVTECEA